MHLVAAASCTSLDELRADSALWRRVRRYNLPVQLALGAASRAHPALSHPATAALISLAPCVSGSAELDAWIEKIELKSERGRLGTLRVNPTHTLHAIDNLALSDLALALENHGYGLGLGGAPGQAWVALELLLERDDAEALVLAGDHRAREDLRTGLGVALAFQRAPAPCPVLGGRTARLVAVERADGPAEAAGEFLASGGLAALLGALGHAPAGSWTWRVPPAYGDGLDTVTLRWELS